MTRTLGIVGGIAPPSTGDYYRRLTALYRERTGDSWPRLLISSVDGLAFFEFLGTDDKGPMAEFLLGELERLARGGADLALFASNSPHIVFDEVAARSPLPLVSIVEATAAEARARGLETLGLLGAGITMEGDFYPAVFGRSGLSLIRPEPDERRLVDDLYMGELVHGVFRDEAREAIAEVAERLAMRGAEAVVLAGTELPVLFSGSELPRMPVLDTTAIHVAAAVERMLAD